MGGESDFERDRRMADERSAANLDWEIKRMHMAGSTEAFEVAGGLHDDRLMGRITGQARAEPALAPIQFYDAGAGGNLYPYPGYTLFTKTFAHQTTARIGYLVDLPNPFLGGQGGACPMMQVLRGAAGQVLWQQPFAPAVTNTAPRIRFFYTMGFHAPGHWALGNYAFEVYVLDQLAVRDGFMVV